MKALSLYIVTCNLFNVCLLGIVWYNGYGILPLPKNNFQLTLSLLPLKFFLKCLIGLLDNSERRAEVIVFTGLVEVTTVALTILTKKQWRPPPISPNLQNPKFYTCTSPKFARHA